MIRRRHFVTLAAIATLLNANTLVPGGENEQRPILHTEPSREDIESSLKAANKSERCLARLFEIQRKKEERRQHMRTRPDHVLDDNDPVTVLVAASPSQRRASAPHNLGARTEEACGRQQNVMTP